MIEKGLVPTLLHVLCISTLSFKISGVFSRWHVSDLFVNLVWYSASKNDSGNQRAVTEIDDLACVVPRAIFLACSQ